MEIEIRPVVKLSFEDKRKVEAILSKMGLNHSTFTQRHYNRILNPPTVPKGMNINDLIESLKRALNE